MDDYLKLLPPGTRVIPKQSSEIINQETPKKKSKTSAKNKNILKPSEPKKITKKKAPVYTRFNTPIQTQSKSTNLYKFSNDNFFVLGQNINEAMFTADVPFQSSEGAFKNSIAENSDKSQSK